MFSCCKKSEVAKTHPEETKTVGAVEAANETVQGGEEADKSASKVSLTAQPAKESTNKLTSKVAGSENKLASNAKIGSTNKLSSTNKLAASNAKISSPEVAATDA